MDDQTKQQMPIKIMEEICRFSAKLQEMGATKTPLKVETNVAVVSDSLVYTTKLLFDKTVLAEHKVIDSRPVADVSAEAEAKKQEVQDQADAVKAELEKVITACKPKK